jgi:hypothetical protein
MMHTMIGRVKLLERGQIRVALLGLICAIGLGCGVWSLLDGSRSAEIMASRAKPLSLPKLDDQALPPRPQLNAIRDRALVYGTRAYYVRPPDPPAPTTPPVPEYRLAGVLMSSNGKSTALLTHKSTSVSKKVRAGDDLDSWKVVSVERGLVKLSFDKNEAQIRGDGAGSAQMAKVALVRNPLTASVGGIRQLSGTGSSTTSATQSAALFTEARLYRPPPP